MRETVRLTAATLAILGWGCAEPTSIRDGRAPNPSFHHSSRGHVVVVDGRPHSTGIRTIQEGIDLVDPGGVVAIMPATYPESIVISKGVTLRAVGGPVIIAPGHDVADFAVTVTATEPVVLHGLTIVIDGIGVLGLGRVHLTLDSTRVFRANIGVEVVNEEDSTGGRAKLFVRNSAFDGGVPATMAAGIFVVTDVDGIVVGNRVRRTTFSCIQPQGTANADVIGNVVDECGPIGGIRAPMAFPSDSTSFQVVNIIGNTVLNSLASNSRAGIFMRHGTGHIENNFVVNYVQPSAGPVGVSGGIVIDRTGNPVIRFNDIVGNAVAGLRNNTANLLDATCNWWGSASGPSGSDVVGLAVTSPFATAPIAQTGGTSC